MIQTATAVRETPSCFQSAITQYDTGASDQIFDFTFDNTFE